MSNLVQRCVYVQGIGRCHVLGEGRDSYVTIMDSRDVALIIRAADIICGVEPGRILWSVRFREKEAA